ncbi:LysR family transcriptional regulator [Microbacterium hatanonis]|jgi:DNA-binding transcriptional LysR family regulator|uniref:LysR family transcriptional regulator n=1 Tax=Microbacterium hatanonis TaxID=404366 RepID=A0A5C8HX05_9MICO|nr:LysR family transcriptional regulator [Microbacterium hatanonis]TXK09524.1 LysR family transcriptional regulator [Microbacterium hatanonis]
MDNLSDEMIDAGLFRAELTFRQLAHFVAAAEEGTISGAARRLQFSASAIAASITELERVLGAELCIRRRAQGITLTSTGSLVLPRARRLLSEVAELGFAVRGDGEQLVGPLVVGCFVTLAPAILPRVLEEFEDLHPRVSIDFTVDAQDELRAALLAGSIDAAIMYAMGDMDDLESFVLYEARGYALFGESNPLARQDTVTVQQLAEAPLVLFDQTPSTRYAMSLFDGHGVVPRVRHRTHVFELTRSIVARSDSAYAILVQRPSNKSSYEGLPIVEKEIEPTPPPVSVVFAWARGTSPSQRTLALAELMRAQYPRAASTL